MSKNSKGGWSAPHFYKTEHLKNTKECRLSVPDALCSAATLHLLLLSLSLSLFFLTGEYTIEFALWMHCVQVKEQSSVPGRLPQSPQKEDVTKTKPCRENNMNRSTWIQCSRSNVLYSLVGSPYILNMLFKKNSQFACWKLFPLRLVITATLWSAKNRRRWEDDCEVANIDVECRRGMFKPASSHKYVLTKLKQGRGAFFLFCFFFLNCCLQAVKDA